MSRLGGGIGRRKGLKIPRGLSLYEFDSRPRHQMKTRGYGFYAEPLVLLELLDCNFFVTVGVCVLWLEIALGVPSTMA